MNALKNFAATSGTHSILAFKCKKACILWFWSNTNTKNKNWLLLNRTTHSISTKNRRRQGISLLKTLWSYKILVNAIMNLEGLISISTWMINKEFPLKRPDLSIKSPRYLSLRTCKRMHAILSIKNPRHLRLRICTWMQSLLHLKLRICTWMQSV